MLINCDTSVDDDVAVFYATYFHCSDISLDGDMVVITGANLPPHLSYYYGEGHEQHEDFDYSRGDEYRPNPNEIASEKYTFDSIDGHPQQQGAYHYHAASPGPLRILMELEMVTTDVPGEAEIELYGVMCDGTVLMGLVELDGSGVADEIGADPRGLSPEVQYYDSCLV